MIFQIPPPNFEEGAALARIDDLRRDLRHYVSEPTRWVGQIRRVLSARAIQGSNSIEGYNVSDEDALAAVEGDEPGSATLENWQAVQDYQRAMTYVLQLAHDEHFAYSPQIIRSLHFMITEHGRNASPGLWRPGPSWIRNDATGEVAYDAPDAEEVPGLIDELVQQLGGADNVPVQVKGAMAHLNLVMIHPFRDGNGRMARALQTLVLGRDQLLEAPFSSIEEYLGGRRSRTTPSSPRSARVAGTRREMRSPGCATASPRTTFRRSVYFDASERESKSGAGSIDFA